ncbi:MAG TPA: hypothetical protein VH637_14225 [Streptosporangiaceae bacterium]
MLLIVAVAGIAVALRQLPQTYQANSSVLLLASRSAAKTNGGNPYLSFSPSLTLTADVLSRELMAPAVVNDLASKGYTATYTAELAPYTTTTTGSVLLISVTGSEPAQVQSTLTGVTHEVARELAQLQKRVKPASRIRSATLSYSPQATLSVTQSARSMVIVIALGLLLVIGVPVVVDGWLLRRKIRAALLVPGGGPGPGGPLPDTRDLAGPADWGPAPGRRLTRRARAGSRPD